MIVYVITKGEYSDYGIVAVTLEKEKAEELKILYSDSWGEAMIETYDTDDYYVENGRFYIVEIGKKSAINVQEVGVISMDDRNEVKLITDWRTKKEKYVVYVKANDEEHAKKIASDLVAKYKAQEQGI